jgi:hypothetical protein
VSKHQSITALYEATVTDVTASPAAWAAFLRSACRNYKCRFDEQLLIYAQRPDATAVLEIEKWNRQFGRWVNRGAKGIAVFDDSGKSRLKHYFDVSDTHESRTSRPVPIWQMRPEDEAEVIESLENSFGELEDASTLPAALVSAAQNATEDNIADYLRDITEEPPSASSISSVPQIHLGDTVYIGTHEYEVLAFDESIVRLYDTEFPMVNAELPRDVFDQRVAENPLNAHLLKPAELPAVPEPDTPTPKPITPAWEKQHTLPAQSETPQAERRNYRITDDDLGAGGAKAKYRANIEAIRTLQTTEAENRLATQEEQEVLSRYVGWGGIQQAFDPDNPSWTNEYAELKALLSPDEYASARASTLNAHYTTKAVPECTGARTAIPANRSRIQTYQSS